jgi:hypothetical protein
MGHVADRIISQPQQPSRPHAQAQYPQTLKSHPNFNLPLSFAAHTTKETGKGSYLTNGRI